jgi:hypothetical protein
MIRPSQGRPMRHWQHRREELASKRNRPRCR